MRSILMLAALATALTACNGPQPAARDAGGKPALSSGSSELLPGEVKGCDGDDCAAGKPDINEQSLDASA